MSEESAALIDQVKRLRAECQNLRDLRAELAAERDGLRQVAARYRRAVEDIAMAARHVLGGDKK